MDSATARADQAAPRFAADRAQALLPTAFALPISGKCRLRGNGALGHVEYDSNFNFL
jgi:hypothetical protein